MCGPYYDSPLVPMRISDQGPSGSLGVVWETNGTYTGASPAGSCLSTAHDVVAPMLSVFLANNGRPSMCGIDGPRAKRDLRDGMARGPLFALVSHLPVATPSRPQRASNLIRHCASECRCCGRCLHVLSKPIAPDLLLPI